MQKKSQKKTELVYSQNVLDIIQFGSSVLESSKPNDKDIAVIFKNISLKQQLEEAQAIKRQLEEKETLPVHIKSYDFYSFFDAGNFAKESILFYGKSIISNERFCKRFGLKSKVQIFYNLSNLEKKDKVKFNYLLNGKKGEYGLLRKYSGSLIRPGLIEIEPEYELIFVEAMKKITNNLSVKKVFLQV